MNAQRHLEITLGNLIIQNCSLQEQVEALTEENQKLKTQQKQSATSPASDDAPKTD